MGIKRKRYQAGGAVNEDDFKRHPFYDFDPEKDDVKEMQKTLGQKEDGDWGEVSSKAYVDELIARKKKEMIDNLPNDIVHRDNKFFRTETTTEEVTPSLDEPQKDIIGSFDADGANSFLLSDDSLDEEQKTLYKARIERLKGREDGLGASFSSDGSNIDWVLDKGGVLEEDKEVYDYMANNKLLKVTPVKRETVVEKEEYVDDEITKPIDTSNVKGANPVKKLGGGGGFSPLRPTEEDNLDKLRQDIDAYWGSGKAVGTNVFTPTVADTQTPTPVTKPAVVTPTPVTKPAVVTPTPATTQPAKLSAVDMQKLPEHRRNAADLTQEEIDFYVRPEEVKYNFNEMKRLEFVKRDYKSKVDDVEKVVDPPVKPPVDPPVDPPVKPSFLDKSKSVLGKLANNVPLDALIKHHFGKPLRAQKVQRQFAARPQQQVLATNTGMSTEQQRIAEQEMANQMGSGISSNPNDIRFAVQKSKAVADYGAKVSTGLAQNTMQSRMQENRQRNQMNASDAQYDQRVLDSVYKDKQRDSLADMEYDKLKKQNNGNLAMGVLNQSKKLGETKAMIEMQNLSTDYQRSLKEIDQEGVDLENLYPKERDETYRKKRQNIESRRDALKQSNIDKRNAIGMSLYNNGTVGSAINAISSLSFQSGGVFISKENYKAATKASIAVAKMQAKMDKDYKDAVNKQSKQDATNISNETKAVMKYNDTLLKRYLGK